ncbi:hypothetical protein [Shimia abyssi]|uniref:SIR2-like protein n=1 Tax=Shimia abyssi TaxID=1662395 RepID=A0A2P8FFN7_9RHOB|nr:hypothetical protein [Shimia abyssi]PSL20529.1 hypothetical protein CLV88_103176 [Shimia abyssi]
MFGFSFADEHILNLVKRSLSNPELQVFICCFKEDNLAEMQSKFRGFSNLELISLEEDLDFNAFNEKVFSAVPSSTGEKP